MRGIKIPKQDFAQKMQGGGGLMRKRWAYLRDTTVHDLITQGRGTGLSHSLVPRLSPRPVKNKKGGGEPGIDSHVISRHERN